MRAGVTRRFAVWAFVAAALVAACSEATGPRHGLPPYLAVVATVVAPSGKAAGARYTYRVRELSGTLGIDTMISIAPRDTLILAVPPASYLVELDSVPPQCKSREGPQTVTVVAGTNTTLVRYFVLCQTQLTVAVLTDGANDGPYAYRLTTADGRGRMGLLHREDTLALDGLPAGLTTVDLAAVPANCILTNNGGARHTVVLDSAGGVRLDFLVRCSDPAHRPSVVFAHATYHDGATGLVFRATDPDRDIDRYVWDLTDCHRNSLLARGGGSTRGGLRGGRTANQDTMTVVTAFEAALPPSTGDQCVSLWVADSYGYASPVVETPLIPLRRGSAPVAAQFNAYFFGTQAMGIDLAARDSDGDLVGVFVAARLRDGTLGQPDGVPDLAYANTAGYLGVSAPPVPLTSTITYDKVLALIVYLIDAQGNFTRLEDDDLFQ
jgi:hypothetical protein